MRRTLLVVTRDLLAAVAGSAGRRVADAERRRLAKEAAGVVDHLGADWIAAASAEIVATLDGRELSMAEVRGELPHLGATFVAAPRNEVVDGRVADLAAADDPRRRRAHRARPQRRTVADLAAALDGDGELARRAADPERDRTTATPCSCATGSGRSGRGRRPTSSGGSGRRRPPFAAPSPTSARSASSWRMVRRGGCCPTTPPTSRSHRTSTSVGVAAADARPDDDGLAAARVLPRPEAHAVPVRHGRERRPDGLGGRPDRRLLGAGRTRRRAADPHGRRARARPSPARCRGRAPRRDARRRAHHQRVRRAQARRLPIG